MVLKGRADGLTVATPKYLERFGLANREEPLTVRAELDVNNARSRPKRRTDW